MQNDWPSLFREGGQMRPSVRKYAVAFTARSGSTWLGDILSKSQLLGQPKEWLNSDAAKNTIIKSGCDDLDQYYRYIQQKFVRNGVFGIEITWPQFRMANMEAQTDNFLSDVPVWFFLRRRDFVAQAVSLHKAIATGHFHSSGRAVDSSEAEAEFEYDGCIMLELVARIMRQEFYWEKFFETINLPPTLLWYEDLVESSPMEIVQLFQDSLGLREQDPLSQSDSLPSSRFSKLASGQSGASADRFRVCNPELVSFWAQNRGRVEDFGN